MAQGLVANAGLRVLLHPSEQRLRLPQAPRPGQLGRRRRAGDRRLHGREPLVLAGRRRLGGHRPVAHGRARRARPALSARDHRRQPRARDRALRGRALQFRLSQHRAALEDPRMQEGGVGRLWLHPARQGGRLGCPQSLRPSEGLWPAGRSQCLEEEEGGRGSEADGPQASPQGGEGEASRRVLVGQALQKREVARGGNRPASEGLDVEGRLEAGGAQARGQGRAQEVGRAEDEEQGSRRQLLGIRREEA
mmetsp:Transcript_66936/g.149949  ORF Transcript_66936/g.149949 Transcript_66936/m.149949 type:complete len:250 (+) Transcript_66936:446-1195(+)